MKKEKQDTSFVNIGSSSLLVIFLILCLATFAILSLSSAQSDHSFAERLAAHKTDYYEASSRAEVITGEVDRILEERAARGAADYPANVIAALDNTEIDGITLSCTLDRELPSITFQVPSGESQALQVILDVTDYTTQDTFYTVRAWQVVSTRVWEADDSLNLAPVIE